MKENIYIEIRKDTEIKKRAVKKSVRNGYSCFSQVKDNLDIIFLLKSRGYSLSDIAKLEGMSYSSLANSIDKAVLEKLTSNHMKNECCIKNLSGFH